MSGKPLDKRVMGFFQHPAMKKLILEDQQLTIEAVVSIFRTVPHRIALTYIII